jgi:hypothetical protein
LSAAAAAAAAAAAGTPLSGVSSWSLAPDKSGLPEVLNVAWAGHEIVSDTTRDMLGFFEQQAAG